MTAPDCELEKELLAAHGGTQGLVAGIDEVGRGALAGPVAVGICVVSLSSLAVPAPQGLNDSKLVSELTREWLEPEVKTWAAATAVGVASAAEIDALGIIAALRLAGERGLAEVSEAGFAPSAIILDGKHNWLHAAADLFAPKPAFDTSAIPVTMKIKADQSCTSVAGASIVAKVWRDGEMQRLAQLPEFEPYGFAGHKGYGAAQHLSAIALHGATEMHRRSWRLPTHTGHVSE